MDLRNIAGYAAIAQAGLVHGSITDGWSTALSAASLVMLYIGALIMADKSKEG